MGLTKRLSTILILLAALLAGNQYRIYAASTAGGTVSRSGSFALDQLRAGTANSVRLKVELRN